MPQNKQILLDNRPQGEATAANFKLVTADVPMWFFRMKGPPTQFLVRGTGLDLERLQITAAHLERFDPSVVIDHARANGDRLLVWTE